MSVLVRKLGSACGLWSRATEGEAGAAHEHLSILSGPQTLPEDQFSSSAGEDALSEWVPYQSSTHVHSNLFKDLSCRRGKNGVKQKC